MSACSQCTAASTRRMGVTEPLHRLQLPARSGEPLDSSAITSAPVSISRMAASSTIGLYVHFPWCVRKCPYCDFNSHEAVGGFEETRYVDRLLQDLQEDPIASDRDVASIYFGGGTPSLFAPESFRWILESLPQRGSIEVTMEANPGAREHADFSRYRMAGINRLSIGVQSFSNLHLRHLGRIHDSIEARQAIDDALIAGFNSVNLDLMFGLPGQSMDQALAELELAADSGVSHISWYQLTIEPNTAFAVRPPKLPTDETRAETWERGRELLFAHGFEQYEISAFARSGHRCEHNSNYWRFGDYAGIGAGAQGKFGTRSGIVRSSRPKSPKRYLNGEEVRYETVRLECVPGEFFMNVLRLVDGVDQSQFESRTGLPFATVEASIRELREWELMHPERLQLTPVGYSALDSVVQKFL